MSAPELRGVALTEGTGRRPLLIVGPSLGTSALSLWHRCAQLLAPAYDVFGWDLPGHGTGPITGAPFQMADLAAGVLELAERVLAERGRAGEAFDYAGVSIGGAVGLQLLLDAPHRVGSATLLCTGARIGEPAGWHERAAQVREQGTAGLVTASAGRWFAPGFLEREPATASALLNALRDADAQCYAWACEALAGFDVTDRLTSIATPVTAVAGGHDQVTPADGLRLIADGVHDGRFALIDDVAHLAPAEDPGAVAQLLLDRAVPESQRRVAGFAARRAVLGDTHVDRAIAATTPFSADFQDFITRYAWGSVWTRPALSRRERSLMTLTALVAGGHDAELALHVRAARRNGLSEAEIGECFLHAAIYCGVPAANTAFRIAADVFAADVVAAEVSDESTEP